MKTFTSKCGDKLVRTESQGTRDGFRATSAVDEVLLVVEEEHNHARILLSKANLRTLRRQLRKVEKELGWKE